MPDSLRPGKAQQVAVGRRHRTVDSVDRVRIGHCDPFAKPDGYIPADPIFQDYQRITRV